MLVEVYFDHFDDSRSVPDNEWLLFAARRKWVALTHDDNIRRDREAVRTIMENSGRVFILRGSAPMEQFAHFFLEAQESVQRILAAHESFIANVRRVTHKGGVMNSTAEVMLTLAKWQAGLLNGRPRRKS